MIFISAFHILVVTPILDYGHSKPGKEILPREPTNDRKSEIIHIKRRKNVWSCTSEYVTNIEMISHYRCIGGFNDVLDGANLMAASKSLYQFDYEKYDWIDYTQGFNIGNSLCIEGKNVEFQQFQHWLSKVYDNFHRISNLSRFSAIKEDLAPRLNLFTASSSTTKTEGSKDSIPMWKRFINNIKGIDVQALFNSCITPSYPVLYDNNQLKTPKQSLRDQWFCKKPTTWILRRTLYSYRYFSSVYETSRYIVFRMKDNVYFAGGLFSPNKVEDERIENNKTFRFDKYNLNEHRWMKCEHTLHYPLEHASVVVSSDQSCAIFTGGQNNWKKRGKAGDRIIIFEEETGFTLLEEKMLKRRSNDVSIIMPV